MKTMIDKEFTHISAVATVKNALKSFKAMYRDSDILEQFNDIMYDEMTWRYVRGDVLEMTVSAFDNIDRIGAVVEAVVFNRSTEFNRLRFHIDIDRDGTMTKIHTDPILVTVEKFTINR